MSSARYDVAIVGAGPAGLSASIVLARSLRSVVVVDAGEPRNAPSPGAHNVLGREGVSPLQLLADGRREAEAYGAEFRATRATTVRRDERGFVLGLADGGELRARRLLLATGLTDELPDIPGLRKHWGTSVLHCPYCHGWEVRGKRIGVIATGPNASHQAQLFRQLSDDVTVLLHDAPPLTDEQKARLEVRGIAVIDGPIARVTESDGALAGVQLADGTALSFDAIVVGPRMVANGDLFVQLGGELTDHPFGGSFVSADPLGRTVLPGVWAAGNTSDLAATVAASAAAGVGVGAQLNAELIEENVQGALAAAGHAAS